MSLRQKLDKFYPVRFIPFKPFLGSGYNSCPPLFHIRQAVHTPQFYWYIQAAIRQTKVDGTAILGRPVTALFCANDLTAAGAMQAVAEAGRTIPDDLSVIGIDDIETSQYTDPPLTTIHIPMENLGIMTAKILIDRIETETRIPMKVELSFRLVRRKSCAPPPET